MMIQAALLQTPRDWFAPRDVADDLGVSKSTVHEWLRTGRIPHLRIGGIARVHRSTLEKLAAAAAMAGNTTTEKDAEK